ncbi:MAG: glycosyltransferase family 2 protein [Neisseria sp.]|nr:glycosyltransferase family 2 protein [Neisseria sp.]
MNTYYSNTSGTPLLSVIVPIYNSQQFLLEALQCLKRQRKFDFEFILVNDASTDDSEKIILEFISKDNRFHYVKNRINSGYGFSCNTGISKSKGMYIAIFEPDDLIPDDFYEDLLITALDNPKADIVKYNGIYEFNQNTTRQLFKMKNLPSDVFLGKSYPRFWRSHPSTINAVYKRDFLVKNNLKYVSGAGASFQDAQFFTALYYANPQIVVIDMCKYLYRKHTNQSVAQIAEEKIDIVIDNWSEFFAIHANSIRKETAWFANIQMYRQFSSLSRHFGKKAHRFNIIYSKHIAKGKIPNILELKWFDFDLHDIVRFYWFVFKGYYLRVLENRK